MSPSRDGSEAGIRPVTAMPYPGMFAAAAVLFLGLAASRAGSVLGCLTVLRLCSPPRPPVGRYVGVQGEPGSCCPSLGRVTALSAADNVSQHFSSLELPLDPALALSGLSESLLR